MDDGGMQIDPQLEQDEDGPCSYIEESSLVPRRDRLGYNPQLQCGYDADLEYDRTQNTNTLRRRFESIFEKYERDFEGIGDEIDLETGWIVIDNGHVANMRHEADPGDNAASEFVQAFTHNLEQEDRVSSSEDSDDDEVPGIGGVDARPIEISSDDESDSAESSSGGFSAQDQATDSATSFLEPDESPQDELALSGEQHHEPQAPSNAIVPSSTIMDEPDLPEDPKAIQSMKQSGEGSAHPTPNALFEQMPGLKDSMLAIQKRHQQGETMDQSTIQALGLSIANQLAALVSSGQHPGQSTPPENPRDRTWQYPELPSDRVPKRKIRYQSPPVPRQPKAPSPTRQSLWAPIQHPRPRKRPRLMPPLPAAATTLNEDASLTNLNDEQVYESQSEGPRKCYNCDCSSTRTWRTGPDGDLCNTCGMYFYRYGLLKPSGDASETDESGTNDFDDEVDPLEFDQLDQQHFLRDAGEPGTFGPKNTHFTLEEDVLLLKLKEIDFTSWEKCALQFPGRSAYALQCRYSKKLHGRPCEARDHLIQEGYHTKEHSNGRVLFDYRRDRFSEEEDDVLLTLRDDGLEWSAIEPSFQGRSAEHLERRYHELAGEYLDESIGSLKSSNKRIDSTGRVCSRYTAQEDELMIRLREDERLGWSEIAQRMPGRNAMSLQKRYIRELAGKQQVSGLSQTLDNNSGEVEDASNSEISLKNMMYSAAEDELLLWYRNEEQLDWADIKEKMPGRDVQSLMNRFLYIRMKGGLSYVQKGMRRINVTEGPNPISTNALIETGRPKSREHDTSTPPVFDSPAMIDPNLREMGSIDDSSNDVPPTEPSSIQHDFTMGSSKFSQAGNTLIVNSHELEHLPWAEIAAQTPDHNVSSISERYFYHLQQRAAMPSLRTINGLGGTLEQAAVPHSRETANTSKPSAIKRWTHGDSEIIRRLREEGMAWEGIATRLPGRSVRAIENHHSAKYGKKHRESLPASASSVAALKAKPDLLRKAVGNNIRRRSESATPDPTLNSVHTTPSETDKSSSSSVIRTHFGPPRRPANWRTPSPEPILMPWDPSEREKRSANPSTRTPEDSPVHHNTQSASPVPSPVSAPEPVVTAERKQATPPAPNERHTPHADHIAVATVPSVEPQPLYPETPYRQFHDGTVSEPSTEAVICYTTPARYNAQAMPYYAAPPLLKYSPIRDETPVGLDDTASEPEERAQPAKKARQMTRRRPVPKKAVQDNRKQRRITLDSADDYGDAVSKSKQAEPLVTNAHQPINRQNPPRKAIHSNRKLQQIAPENIDETSEESEEIVYDETDTEATESDSEDDELLQPVYQTDDQSAQGNKVSAVEVRTNVELPERPALSMIALVANALKSKAPEPMSSKEVSEHIEAEYPFYISDKSSWRDSVRSTLSSRPQFKKATNDFKALWKLSGVDLPMPLRKDDGRLQARTKRKPGRPRKHPLPPPSESNEPPPPMSRANSHTSDVETIASSKNLALQDTGQGNTELDEDEETNVASTHDDTATTASLRNFKKHEPICSTMTRDPESSPEVDTRPEILLSGDESSLVAENAETTSSSSPILTKRKTPRSTYGRTSTPPTSRSTLFEHQSDSSGVFTKSSHPRSSTLRHVSSITDLASGRRVLDTPVRDFDDSEDELAL